MRISRPFAFVLVSLSILFLSPGCSLRKAPFGEPAVGDRDGSQAGPGPATDALNRVIRENKAKVILLSFCNESMKDTSAQKREFDGFLKDPSVSSTVKAICVDPTDSREQVLVKQLGQNPAMSSPVTLALTPPQGKIVGSYHGHPSPQSIRNLLSACSSGGCGPGG